MADRAVRKDGMQDSRELLAILVVKEAQRIDAAELSAELLADLGAGEAEAKAEQSGPSAIKVSGNKPGIRAGSISKRRGATRPLRTRSQYA
jgi:DNA repair protein RadC